VTVSGVLVEIDELAKLECGVVIANEQWSCSGKHQYSSTGLYHLPCKFDSISQQKMLLKLQSERTYYKSLGSLPQF
jgi:hypothetical protein